MIIIMIIIIQTILKFSHPVCDKISIVRTHNVISAKRIRIFFLKCLAFWGKF